MEGKDVGKYFHEGKIKEIAGYCEGDVQACYELFVKFQKLELLS